MCDDQCAEKLMEMSIEIDAFALRSLQRKLKKFPEASGITQQWLVHDTARLAALDAVKSSAPWAGGKPGNASKQRKQGEEAAASDLDRAFARIDDRMVFFESGGRKMARIVATGAVFEIPNNLWKPAIIGRHKQLRNSRGRVPKQPRQAWVVKKELEKYIKTVAARVGKLKASWIPAAEYFARKVNGAVNVPAWVSRHRGDGSYTDTIQRNGNGTCIVTSTAPHNRAFREGTKKFIEQQRNKFLLSASKKRIQQIADQFNRGSDPRSVRA